MDLKLGDVQVIGLVFTGLGFLCMGLGVVLWLDRPFLSMGNMLLLIGIPCIVSVRVLYNFVNKDKQVIGFLCFGSGVALVLIKWTYIGLLLEMYGILHLFGFGNFFNVIVPMMLAFLRYNAYTGWLFKSRII